jgi:universal stress protein E
MSARRVLFAIRNPGAPRQPGLAKAIQVAKALGASLELFHALGDTLYFEPGPYQHEAVDRVRERLEGQARVALARLCESARKHRVAASHAVQWDRPAHEAILRRAAAAGAELIIAECHRGVRLRPWVMHLTDWELLRLSPVPVLLIKNARPYHRPLLLAAVDPGHAHGKPLALDSRILEAAGELGAGLRGPVHLMHANHPSIVGVDVEAAARKAAATWTTLTYDELKQQERSAFDKFLAASGIRRNRAHLVEGKPVVEIPRLAKKLDAGIVVMGALSRSGIARLFIGNTAERVLEALPCDVLVVKPAATAAQAKSR